MHYFAQNLRAVRVFRGFTQADMATHLMVARTTYNSYELGTAEPSLRTLWHIQGKLQVGVDALLSASFYKYDRQQLADALAVSYPRPNVQTSIPMPA